MVFRPDPFEIDENIGAVPILADRNHLQMINTKGGLHDRREQIGAVHQRAEEVHAADLRGQGVVLVLMPLDRVGGEGEMFDQGLRVGWVEVQSKMLGLGAVGGIGQEPVAIEALEKGRLLLALLKDEGIHSIRSPCRAAPAPSVSRSLSNCSSIS